MSSNDGDSYDSTLKLIVKKIRSQFLLFCIAIALVIVVLIQTAGVDAALPIGAILVVFLVGALVYSKVETSNGGKEKDVLELVPDVNSDELDVKVWMKQLDPSRKTDDFRVGDQVRVCVKASTDCYLTLLNFASDGGMTILFPNKHNQKNSIRGETTYEIPSDGYGFNIVLEEPLGVDRVKAIVTTDSKPLVEAQFSADGDFFSSTAPSATPRAMRVVAAKVEEREEKSWAAASTQFEVKSN